MLIFSGTSCLWTGRHLRGHVLDARAARLDLANAPTARSGVRSAMGAAALTELFSANGSARLARVGDVSCAASVKVRRGPVARRVKDEAGSRKLEDVGPAWWGRKSSRIDCTVSLWLSLLGISMALEVQIDGFHQGRLEHYFGSSCLDGSHWSGSRFRDGAILWKILLGRWRA